MATMTVVVSLEEITCGGCGGVFALNATFLAAKRRESGGWHCPYCGNERGYWKSEADKVREELTRERAKHDQTRAELDTRTKALIASEQSAKKAKHRIKNGVCPCCNRTFKQLAAHMKSKHPGYIAERLEGAK